MIETAVLNPSMNPVYLEKREKILAKLQKAKNHRQRKRIVQELIMLERAYNQVETR